MEDKKSFFFSSIQTGFFFQSRGLAQIRDLGLKTGFTFFLKNSLETEVIISSIICIIQFTYSNDRF